jgi:hypothetical protein
MTIDAPSIEKAREYVENDPFSIVNYYQERNIVEVVEGTIENDFLLDDVLSFKGHPNNHVEEEKEEKSDKLLKGGYVLV